MKIFKNARSQSEGSKEMRSDRRGFLALSAAMGASSILPGCALPDRGPAVPSNLTGQATVLGIPNERFLIPHDLPALVNEFELAAERQPRPAKFFGQDQVPADGHYSQ